MKSIINFSLNNKFAVWLLTIMVVIAGLFAGLSMKQETIPDIEIPMLFVTTVYPGATSEEIAEEVSTPIEQRVRNLNGVTGVNATSMDNASTLMVEYDYGKDMKEAENELRRALTGVVLPQGAMESSISAFSIDDFPVISVSVAGENMSLEEVTNIVETEFKYNLEGIDGVGAVDISGQQVKEIMITFDHDKMAELGLSEDLVKGMIQASALQLPLGLFQLDNEEKSIVVDGNIVTMEDLGNIAIPVMPAGLPGMPPGAGAGFPDMGGDLGGAGFPDMGGDFSGAELPDMDGEFGEAGFPEMSAGDLGIGGMMDMSLTGGFAMDSVRLSEIAQIELIEKAESISRTNGKESIGISVTKAASANTVEVVNAVKDEIEQLKSIYPNMDILVMLDQGEPIEESVSTMLDKALYGAIFAFIIILLFLRNIRTTIISVISIPLSLVMTLLILKQMDITLNMMTLGAMTVAIGRVVDDSIVVIENNYRRMQLKSEKISGKALVLAATHEMSKPILSSTLVTVAVFIPLATVTGPVGELFIPFALTMGFALMSSLLVAITIVPILTDVLFRNGVKKIDLEAKPQAMAKRYRQLLNWTLNHKVITSLIAVLLFIGSLGLVAFGHVGTSFLPEEEQKFALVTYSPGPGEVLDEIVAAAFEAEKLILGREGVTDLQFSVGGANPLSPGPSRSALFYVMYEDDTENFDVEKKNLAEALQQIESSGRWGTLDMMGGLGGNTLSLFVYGNDLETIEPVVEELMALLEADESFDKVAASLSETYDEYRLLANQESLSQVGLSAAQIAMYLSPVRDNPQLTSVQVDGQTYPVYVSSEETQYRTLDDITNARIPSPMGFEVPLADLITVEEGTSAGTVTHRNGELYVEVTANIVIDNVGKATTDIQNKIDELELPPSVHIDHGGVAEQLEETFTQLGLAMVAAVGIIYFMLVITFGGASTPFVILFSLPFITIGSFLGLYIADETISAPVMMGFLMLIGIVVTNAIVLIDRVINKEKEGLTVREALLEAAGTRLRPILMTALATIGALVPLALGFEGSNESLISKGLGVAVIGGLFSSTLLTLIIVPIVYEVFAKAKARLSRLFKRTSNDGALQ